MSNGPLEIQKRVFAILSGDATLGAVVSGVYDFVPQDVAFPYVTIGEDDYTDRGSHTTDGFTGAVNVHTWSREASRKQTHEIQGLINDLLHNIDLAVPGFRTVVCRRDFSNILVDPDAKTYHGVQRFTIMIGENI